MPTPSKIFLRGGVDVVDMHTLPEHTVVLYDIPSRGLILDIGGGGEGIIGRLKGEKVVAIDQRLDELQETNNEALKLTMDARKLQFVSNSFSVVTSFFSLMYIATEDHETVLREAYRVLKLGGKLLIWDVVIPPHQEGDPEVILLPLIVRLPNEVIKTTYGVRWRGHTQNNAHFAKLAERVGFEFVQQDQWQEVFFIEMVKLA